MVKGVRLVLSDRQWKRIAPHLRGKAADRGVTASNKVYVTHSSGVTVIDGASNASSAIATAPGAGAIVVNTQTNRVYVASFESRNVTVIDGTSGATSALATPEPARASLARGTPRTPAPSDRPAADDRTRTTSASS